jgi:glycerate kinase
VDISGMDSRAKESSFTIATDVPNILTGVEGAAYIYGPIKGANPLMVQALDRGLRNFAHIVYNQLGIDIENVCGAGAAGGLGGGLMGFLNGKIRNGIDIVIEYTNLEEKLKGADLVITGEGKIDNQIQFGKTSFSVAKLAMLYNIPIVAIAGSLEDGYENLYNYGFAGIFSIVNRPMSLEEAIERTPQLLNDMGSSLIRLLTVWERKKYEQ